MTIPGIPEAWLVLIGQVLTFLTAMVAAMVGLMNRKAISETQAKVQEVHLTVNSRLSELLRSTELAAHNAGMVEQSVRSGSEQLSRIPPTMTVAQSELALKHVEESAVDATEKGGAKGTIAPMPDEGSVKVEGVVKVTKPT